MDDYGSITGVEFNLWQPCNAAFCPNQFHLANGKAESNFGKVAGIDPTSMLISCSSCRSATMSPKLRNLKYAM